MYGDFSRDSFRPEKHYRRVLMQQGRVLLDADFNEQTAILLHYHQALTRALAGPFAAVGDGFKLSAPQDRQPIEELKLTEGHYFVEGLLCELVQDTLVTPWPDGPVADGTHMLYLAVWERHVDPCEDATLADPALGDAEAMGRNKIEWRMCAKPVDADSLALPRSVVEENIEYDVYRPAKTGAFTASIIGTLLALLLLIFNVTSER